MGSMRGRSKCWDSSTPLTNPSTSSMTLASSRAIAASSSKRMLSKLISCSFFFLIKASSSCSKIIEAFAAIWLLCFCISALYKAAAALALALARAVIEETEEADDPPETDLDSAYLLFRLVQSFITPSTNCLRFNHVSSMVFRS